MRIKLGLSTNTGYMVCIKDCVVLSVVIRVATREALVEIPCVCLPQKPKIAPNPGCRDVAGVLNRYDCVLKPNLGLICSFRGGSGCGGFWVVLKPRMLVIRTIIVVGCMLVSIYYWGRWFVSYLAR